MKLSISKNHLNDAVQNVLKAVSSKTSIPILSGIKIDTDFHGVSLTASDTDITIQSFIAAEIDGNVIVNMESPGSVVLPAKFFSEILRKLPKDQVEIEVNEHHLTTIRSGSVDIQIVGLDPEEFPLLPQIDENRTISLSSELLKSMIRQTVFAVSSNESTPVLTGVLWTVDEGILKFTACDRHRLASREIRIDIDSEAQINPIVVAGRTLNELQKIIPEQNVLVDISITDNQVLFKFSDTLFYSRILDGTYPDTSKLIPQTFQTELVVETKMFEDAIDRAYLLSREDKTNIVKLVMKENQTIEISSSSNELGKVTEELVSKELAGDLLKISFNSKFMLDALKVIDSELLHIGFTGAMHPIIVKPVDDLPNLHLILPYRTTN